MSDQTYRIERCEHDIDKHYNAIVMGGHFVGRLEEHLPSCDGSKLVPDTRLQAIADAWNEYVEAEKENINATVEWLNVVKLLDALTKEEQ